MTLRVSSSPPLFLLLLPPAFPPRGLTARPPDSTEKMPKAVILLELNCEERSGNWPICSWQFALRARRFCWQLRVVRRRSHRTDQLPRAGRRHVNPVFVPTCVFDVIFRWGIRKMCRPARKQLALAVHTSASGRFSPQLLAQFG